MMYYSREIQELNRQKRRARMQTAREKGTHTKAEWVFLVDIFGRCVICGDDRPWLCKDHIVPIYAGGCDCIANIQPVCHRCNSQKGADDRDWRSHRNPHWSAELARRLGEAAS